MANGAYEKPLPRINRLSRPFWEGTKRHELLLQRCASCGLHRFPPSEHCPGCLATETEWARASGRGKVWSWIRMWQPYFPAFAPELPYTVAYVQLDEGPRLMTNLVNCDPDANHCDMPVEVVFEEVSDEVTLPKFRPVTMADG